MVAFGSPGAATRLEGVGKIGAGPLDCGNQAGDDARHRSCKEAESEDPPIHPEVEQAQWKIGRYVDGHQRPSGPTREDQAEESAAEREQDAFGEKLAHHAPPAGTQRCSRGNFFATSIGTREDQIRHVRAGNQQDEPYKQHKYDRRSGHESAETGFGAGIKLGQDEQGNLFVTIGKFLGQASIDWFGGGHSLCRRYTRLEAAQNAQA